MNRLFILVISVLFYPIALHAAGGPVEIGTETRSPARRTILVEWAGASQSYVSTTLALLSEVKQPATRPVEKLPAREKLHLYVLMGQSNMAGRGEIGVEDKTPHPRVVMLNLDGKWEQAVEPITRDRKNGLGVGPGLAFGKWMAEKDPEVTIGLVPCAVGGTPLSRWQKGGDLYEKAMARARTAAEFGTIKGVLWHQGESEAGDEKRAGAYGEGLAKMVRSIRDDLKLPELPFVAGQLGEFLYTRTENKSPFARVVNEQIMTLPKRVKHTAVISPEGLKHKGDELHFDAASEREMGRRYGQAIADLRSAKVDKP